MRVYVSGAWKEVSGARIRVDGAWKNLRRIRAYIGGAWRDVATFVPPMTVAITPSLITETLGSSEPVLVTTNAATATPTGGVAPYTYSWAVIGGGSGVANSAGSATTVFSRVVNPFDTITETFRCTVTDSVGNTATADTDVTFGNSGFG